jgi:hypothetical protein
MSIEAIIAALRDAGGGSIKICVGEKPYEEDERGEEGEEGEPEGGAKGGEDDDEPDDNATGYNRAASPRRGLEPRITPRVAPPDESVRGNLMRAMAKQG